MTGHCLKFLCLRDDFTALALITYLSYTSFKYTALTIYYYFMMCICIGVLWVDTFICRSGSRWSLWSSVWGFKLEWWYRFFLYKSVLKQASKSIAVKGKMFLLTATTFKNIQIVDFTKPFRFYATLGWKITF